MTDITPMPNNAENYYRKAINALENNNFSKGIHFLEMSYSIDPTPSVFSELVKLYIMLNRKNDLKQIWNNDLYSFDHISQSNMYSILFAQSVPIMNPVSESLIELYQLRDQNPNPQVSDEINQAIQKITDFLNIQKELSLLNNSTTLTSYIDSALENGSLALLSKLKSIYQIDLDKSIHFLNAILIRPDVLNFIKNDILHFLIADNTQKTVTFKWFDQEYSMNISDLSPYFDTPFYQEGKKIIDDYFSQSDPHFAEQIIELFNLHSMVLFPFSFEVFETPERWLQSILIEFGLAEETDFDVNLTEKEKKYYHLAKAEMTQLFY